MNTNMYSRHYRYNPLFSNPTVSDVPDPLHLSFFGTIIQARAFLNQVACLNPKQLTDPQMQSKIEAAKKIAAKADRRNDRRKARRAKQAGKATPAPRAYAVTTCKEAQRSVESLCEDVVCGPSPTLTIRDKKAPKIDESGRIAWEEVLGPKGEVVRFKLNYHKDGPSKGLLKERKRTLKESPKPSEIILDLTFGIKAWRVATNKTREEIPITKQMEDFYKGSNLYRVRQLAAGYISIDQFAAAVKGESVAARRSLKKKKKS